MEENNVLKFSTLTQLLIDKDNEKENGITFVKSKSEEIRCSFHEIYRKSLCILGYLQSKGLKSKDKLVFQLGENYDFIHVFWACILGGIVPVPIVADEKDEFRRKLYNVLLILENGYVIGKKDSLTKLKEFAEQENYDFNLVNERFIDCEQTLLYSENGQLHAPMPEDTAFIQFSSGSTGMPKGVVLTHRNLMLNIDAIIAGVNLNRKDVIVSWMPLTHDMGLIGCHLAMTAADVAQCTMNTMLFVVKPTLWLDKITEHKGTILASPNFGLKYALLGLERNRNKNNNYDFSNVRIIFNGAEPISIKICDEFMNQMSNYGLKESSMFPVYGMAEATLAIAFPKLNEGRIHRIVINRNSLKVGEKIIYLDDENDASASSYVDEGYAVKHCEIRVCDHDSKVLGSDMLGIIQIKGGSVSDHYYSNKDATEESRTADGWFKTGDLGFFCNDRLVVIGRSQEIVIVNGQNYFSNDLERIACEVKKIGPNKVAICSTIDQETQTEKILAFVVHKGDNKKFVPITFALREQFAKTIGINMDYIIPVATIPKTSSGKLMRFTLKENFDNGSYKDVIDECNALIEEERLASNAEFDERTSHSKQQSLYNIHEVNQTILAICNEVSPDLKIGLNDNFFQYGINSLLLNHIAARLDEIYPNRITSEDFFKYSSIQKLAKYICGIEEENSKYSKNEDFPKNVNDNKRSDIAIIGMSAILPGASNIHEFWSNLCGGVESVGSLPNTRKNDVDNYLNSLGVEGVRKVNDSGFIYEIDKFDHEFFKVLKREAIAMSPSQRLFLETAYASIEDAGYGGDALKSSKTGVYVGYISDLEGYQYQDILKKSKDSQSATGALSANISGRLSYFMDFKGPSLIVDSACSASMSALNIACQGIANGDCEQAIVGGVQLKVLPIIGNDPIGIESSDGHTRPFAENADGTGEGEGIVSILIKPYDKAKKDKDHVYAVIRSIHTNQDGHSVGLSAPNPDAQAALIIDTVEKSELSVEDISYIEAHGTGTKLGDPIEINALTKAFRSQTDLKQFCAIGSVKSNIGHLYASSGLVSIVKCCMMLKHKVIPATVNIESLNSKINFADSPFYVNRHYKKWDTEMIPRRCGVSNFGFSGTNCHTILEEFIEDRSTEQAPKSYPFVLSATTRNGLKTLANTYFDYLTSNNELRLADICYTASMGRGHDPHRLAIVAKDTKELIQKLGQFDYATQLKEQIYVGEVKVVQDLRKGVQWGELTSEDVEQLNESTRKYISNFLSDPKEADRDRLMEKICGLYVRGSQPCWNDLFMVENCRRESLPTYLFNKNRCWPEFLVLQNI
ncbi:Phosphopantetheine attachment site [Fontibacillus panacisegetis]|uniref:Phosphopantetheine attachment site n=1 Tax=Fontibacillus panacisegetis TaxID=670482 RepID=A0A1G7QQ29_9BACL|nr:beta-ketoacyl synthase N-terminal-like domain-containing protein [Fontibacillus panacisegetis]SDG00574.1 Phosphopantetheine attachment site [Fontibacillus panacisegetis]